MASPPLKTAYQTPDAIRARLDVLYEKLDRIVVYNRTLDPRWLDEKQATTMRRYDRRPGVDGFPRRVRRKVAWTVDVLQARLVCLGYPPYVPAKRPVSRRRLGLRERVQVFRWKWEMV